jgi:hypothetical protein
MERGREHCLCQDCISRLKIFAAECKICSSERVSFVSLISKSVGAIFKSDFSLLAALIASPIEIDVRFALTLLWLYYN